MRGSLHRKKFSRRKGFSLLELVVALGMFGILIGMIFRMSRASMELSQTVVDEQSLAMERNAFFNMLKYHFEQMPGNTLMRLQSYEVGSGNLKRDMFNLTFQNVPMSFHWGEVPMTAEAMQLATVQQRDGFVDIVLRFYEEEILDDSDSGLNEDIEPIAQITLIEDMWLCDCVAVDGRTLEELTDWDNDGQLPLQVKFYCRFEPTSDIVLQTFWVVPKQNPEVIMRQVMQQNPAGLEENSGGVSTPGVIDSGGTGGSGRVPSTSGGGVSIPNGSIPNR